MIMIRTLSLATILTAALVFPVVAEDTKTKIEPGSGPTSTMTDAAAPMQPGNAELQSDSKSSPGAKTAAAPAEQSPSLSLTVQEGMTWINKPIYSSDGKEIGKVAAFQRDGDNKVIGMHADVGGFLGLGQTRVNLTPAQFKLQGDRIALSLTAEQAKDLPAVMK
jgi:PRC-barrel domain